MIPQGCFNLNVYLQGLFSPAPVPIIFVSYCGKHQTLPSFTRVGTSLLPTGRGSLYNVNPDFSYNEHSKLFAILFGLFVVL